MDTNETRSALHWTVNFLCALLVLVVILAVPLSWFALAMKRERKALGTLRAAGEPTCFAELVPYPIPRENDAAFFLDRASPDLKAFGKEQADFFRTPLGEAFRNRRMPTPEQVAAISDILAHYPDLPHVLEQAAACEGYTSKIDFSVGEAQMMNELLQVAKTAKSPAHFLRWRITVLLAEGKPEKAVNAGLVMLRLARLNESEPGMTNGLIGIAIRAFAIEQINLVLRAGPISPALRELLDEELVRHDDPQRFVRVIKTERAINMSALKGLPFWLNGFGKGLQVEIIDFYDKLLPLLSQPWHQSQMEIHNSAANYSFSTQTSASLIKTLVPALQAGFEAENRSTAMIRSLRILNHLTAYAQENGHEARGLDDLDLSKAATLDPFSGDSLKLKWTDEGWVVYTVYKNGIDDNGNFRELADRGIGPREYPSAD